LAFAGIPVAALGAGAVLGAAILGLTYMAGKFFQSQSLQAYAKMEVEEYILSAFLIAVCLAIVVEPSRMAIINGVAGTSVSDQAGLDSAIESAFSFETSRLYNVFEGLAKNTFRVTKVMAFNFNFVTPNVYVPFTVSASRSPSAGGAGLITSLVGGADSVSMLMLLVKAERVFYFFLQFVTQTFMLPAGFVLRFIPQSRKVGGMLIGASLGVLVVFPAGILWTHALLSNANNGLLPTGSIPVVADRTSAQVSIACSKTVAAATQVGEIVGPLLACLVYCAFAAVTGPGGYALCLGGISAFPQWLWPTGTPGCIYTAQEIWYWVKTGLQLAGIGQLLSNPFNISSEDFLRNYFDPLVGRGGVLSFAMQTSLAIIAATILQLIVFLGITRNLALFFGAEGQFYGMSKLI